MNELSSMEQERMKEIESVREEIERQLLLSVERYMKYVDEVRKKTTDLLDLWPRTTSSLHCYLTALL